MATRKPVTLVNGLFQEVNTPADKLDLAGNTTTDLTEGTNLYYTDARARGSISLSTTDPAPNTGLGSLTYNSSTGAFTFTSGGGSTYESGSFCSYLMRYFGFDWKLWLLIS